MIKKIQKKAFFKSMMAVLLIALVFTAIVPLTSQASDEEIISKDIVFMDNDEQCKIVTVDFSSEDITAGGKYFDPDSIPDDPSLKDMVFDGWSDGSTTWTRDTVSGLFVVNDGETLIMNAVYSKDEGSIPKSTEKDAEGKSTSDIYYDLDYVVDGKTVNSVVVPENAVISGEVNSYTPDTSAWPEGATAFSGWFTTPNGSTKFDFDKTMEKNVKVYAQFKYTYLINFTDNNGDVIDSMEVLPNELLTETNAVISSGNGSKFEYWYYLDKDQNEVIIDFGEDIATQDLTLSPKFNDRFYILFISGGTQVETQYVNLGEKIENITAPTRNGYTFSQWTLDEEGTKSFNRNEPITSNLVLYAQWAPQTTQFKVVNWIEKANLTQGDVVIDNKQSNFQYEGEVIYGGSYNVKSGTPIENATESNGIKVGKIEITPSAPNYMYYSHYTVSNGDTAVKGNGATVINIYYKRTVYDFKFNLRTTSTITVTPTMVMAGSTYNQSSGNDCGYVIKAKFGENVNNRWPSRKNATFVSPNSSTANFQGWKGSDVNFVTHRDTITTELMQGVEGNVKIFPAVWVSTKVVKQVYYYFEVSADDNYDVKYTSGSTTYYFKLDPVNTQEIISDGNVTAKTIDGYDSTKTRRFTGISNGTATGVTATLSQNVANNYFLYFRTAYALSFDTNGGSMNYSSSSLKYTDLYLNESLDRYVDNVTTTRTDDGTTYEFMGWYYEDSYITKYEKGDKMPNHNVCLYAKWEASDLELTLMESASSSKVLDKVRISTNDYVTDEITGYIKGNYYENKDGEPLGEFAGWLIKREDGKFYEFSSEIPIREDGTLYAKWVTDGFKVTYDQGASSTNVANDINIYKLGTQARLSLGKELSSVSGKVFIGWEEIINGESTGIIYYPGSIYTVNCNVTMKALFDDPANYLKVTYHKNDGSSESLIYYVKKDTVISLLNHDTFSRDGYKMDGWASEKTGMTPFSEGSSYNVQNNNVNFYAQWVADDLTVAFAAEKGGSVKGKSSFNVTNPERGSEYEVEFGSITVPEPTPDTGYYFAGWKPALPDDNSVIYENAEYKATFAAKGELKIRPKELSKTYDGKQLRTTDDAIDGFIVTGLDNNHKITSVKTVTALTDVGTEDNIIDKNSIVVTDTKTGEVVNYQYNISPEPGYMEIEKAKLTVTADSHKLYVRTEIPEFTYNIKGFVNNEDASAIKTVPEIKTNTAVDNNVPGAYNVIPYGAAADNYYFSYTSGELVYYIEGSVVYSSNDGDGNVPVDNNVYDEKNNAVKVLYNKQPAKVGYNFIGWSLDIDGSDIYMEGDGRTVDFMANVDSEDCVVLYAQYRADFSDFTVADVTSGYDAEEHSIDVAGIKDGDIISYKVSYGSGTDYTEIRTTSTLPVFKDANVYTTSGYKGDKIKVDVTVKRGTFAVTKTAFVTILQNPVTVKVVDASMEYVESQTLYPTAVAIVQGTMIKDHTLDMTNAKFTGSQSTIGYSCSSVSDIGINGTHDDNYDITYKDGVLSVTGVSEIDPFIITEEDETTPAAVLIPPETANYNPVNNTSLSNNGAGSTTSSTPRNTDSQMAADNSITIGNTEVPLFGAESSYWALINLILAAVTALLFLTTAGMYMRNRKKDDEHEGTGKSDKEWIPFGLWLLMLIPSVGSIVLFIITEDMSLSMALTDKWTLLMTVLFVIQAAMAVYVGRRSKKENSKMMTA